MLCLSVNLIHEWFSDNAGILLFLSYHAKDIYRYSRKNSATRGSTMYGFLHISKFHSLSHLPYRISRPAIADQPTESNRLSTYGVGLVHSL